MLSEDQIISRWDGSVDKPLVSICCATFNHANLIEDALCSFLTQNTTFPFEIIIRDDASEDGTTNIVKNYSLRYPRIVKAIINSANQYKVGVKPSHVWGHLAKGKYIALCEGDDFWTSTAKLQNQFDLLEENPSCVLCVANTVVARFRNNKIYNDYVIKGRGYKIQTYEDMLDSNYHTSTFVFNKIHYENLINFLVTGKHNYDDYVLRALSSTSGCLVLDETVSCYRITEKGVWTGLKSLNKYLHLLMCAESLLEISGSQGLSYQYKRIFWLHRMIFWESLKLSDFRTLLKNFPLLLKFACFRYFGNTVMH